MSERIVSMLRADADEEYRAFQQPLIPDVPREHFIGVRTPALRALAKEINADHELRAELLSELPHGSFEENQLHFFVISMIRDFSECIAEVERFLPYIDNWAVCDQSTPKCFAKHRSELMPYIDRWLTSAHAYTVRYAIGLLMKLYLGDGFDPICIDKVVSVHSEEYYVMMMQAWYMATALAKQWESALPVIEERRLPVWVHNKSIQKARESLRVSAERKEYLKGLKVK